MTTNLPFARWSEVFLDPTAAGRGHRPDRAPRDGAADVGRQLPAAAAKRTQALAFAEEETR